MNRTATPHPLLNGRATAPAPAPPRPAGKPWSYRDFACFIGCSERHIAGLAAAGRIRVIRVGARVYVPDDEAQRIAREGTG